MDPLRIEFVLPLLVTSTAAVVWGSVLALREGRRWGYLLNTAGLIGFWLAPFMPARIDSSLNASDLPLPFASPAAPDLVHRTDCYLLEQKSFYPTIFAAAAVNRRPCPVCLGTEAQQVERVEHSEHANHQPKDDQE